MLQQAAEVEKQVEDLQKEELLESTTEKAIALQELEKRCLSIRALSTMSRRINKSDKQSLSFINKKWAIIGLFFFIFVFSIKLRVNK